MTLINLDPSELNRDLFNSKDVLTKDAWNTGVYDKC